MLTRHLTLRLEERLHKALARRARESARGELTVLARQYIEEGLLMDRYPGIVFRDGRAGRRPALAGRRVDVPQVIETFLASGKDPATTAEYLGLTQREVGIALAFYADHREEIDAWLRDGQEAADEAQAARERQQQILRA